MPGCIHFKHVYTLAKRHKMPCVLIILKRPAYFMLFNITLTESISLRRSRFSTNSMVCVPLRVQMCIYVHVCEHSEEVNVVKLQQGCFRQNSVPEGTRAITHNSPALIGCIQLLYWKLSSFCCPQVAITSHLPFSSHCFATYMFARLHTDTLTATASLICECFSTQAHIFIHLKDR